MKRGDDYTADHQDQGFSEGAGRVEATESVFIIWLGATRPLAFLTLDGDETKRIQLASGDCYELTGPVNACSRHSVPPEPNCGLCVTLSFRLVRNRIAPDGSFAVVNGKKVSLDEQTRQIMKMPKAELARRLAGLPAAAPAPTGRT